MTSTSQVRIRPSGTLRPLQVVLLFVGAIILSGSALLLSVPETTQLMEGAVPWQAESLLRSVVQVLCLNYQFPTLHAGTVKSYLLGIGTGTLLIAMAIALLSRSRGGEDELAREPALSQGTPGAAPWSNGTSGDHLAALRAAMILIACFLLWSFASTRWSTAPDLALGGSVLVSIEWLWALGLGLALGIGGARVLARILVCVTVLTAIVAVWYYYGRNPLLRAMFPYGNPTFLAAALVPGILLMASWLIVGVRPRRPGNTPSGDGTKASTTADARNNTDRTLPWRTAGLIAGLAISLWAFSLTQSRGATAGLAFGMLTIWFLAARGRARWLPLGLGLLALLAGLIVFSRALDTTAGGGRDTTLRFRAYAWTYAWRLFKEKPITGHGQGGYTLRGDAYAVQDVLRDPQIFEARLAHAHSEWLETASDLGLVGVLLLAAAGWLTWRALRGALFRLPTSSDRWTLIGLAGGLMALIVDAAFGVGLRVGEVSPVFFTIVGLTWAMSGHGGVGPLQALSAKPVTRVATAALFGTLGLAALVLTQQDWESARNAYHTDKALADGDVEQAVQIAGLSAARLNPQRALVQFFMRGEAHWRAARILQRRAMDREQRAIESEPPNPRLLLLGMEDYAVSDAHCEQASHYLKQLLLRSPGFINHGWLECEINLTRADNAEALSRLSRLTHILPDEVRPPPPDHDVRERFLRNAVAALDREIQRQPFQPALAVQYVRLARPILSIELRKAIDTLARPLRFNAIDDSYMNLLRQLSTEPTFDAELQPLMREALSTAAAIATGGPPAEKETWAPERLRLLAAILFIRGEYVSAREALSTALQTYDALPGGPPLGAADASVQLAVSSFFHDPDDIRTVLEAVNRAIQLTPASLPGRELARAARQWRVLFLLGAGNEPAAVDVLRELAPRGAPAELIDQQLGASYAQLCQMLLRRREAQVLRKPLNELLPRLYTWIQRSIELVPDDPGARYMAADLAFHSGDIPATVEHLDQALRHGLPLERALQFLSVARQKKPDDPRLEALWQALIPPPPDGEPTQPELVEPDTADDPPAELVPLDVPDDPER